VKPLSSVFRFLQITRGFRYEEMVTPCRIWLIVCVESSLLLLYSLAPLIFSLHNDWSTRNEYLCEYFNIYPRWYFWGLAIVTFLNLPILCKYCISVYSLVSMTLHVCALTFSELIILSSS